MEMETVIIVVGLSSLLLVLVSWKWCLPRDRSAILITVAAVIGLLGGTALMRSGVNWLLTFLLTGLVQGFIYCGALLWLFYRDPERIAPDEPGLILSPADGTVIYVRQLEAGEPLRSEKNGAMIILDEIRDTAFAQEALWQVGISMVFTDVHVNRAPIQGILTLVHHRPGKFLSLRREEALNLNERQTLIIENHSQNMQVMLVQIASRLVRQIVAYVKQGQLLDRGQRVGMIRFGSQVDLFLPVHKVTRLEVNIGQRLLAGATIIARYSESPLPTRATINTSTTTE
jgi:phosphatidylserine decarboxylase